MTLDANSKLNNSGGLPAVNQCCKHGIMKMLIMRWRWRWRR